MATPEASAARVHAGGAARSRCSFCLARQKTARLKTRLRASRPAVPAPIGPGLSFVPAQRREKVARYVPVVVAITFDYEGKHGIGTDTDGANTVVLMGARLYNPMTGRFLQVDPLPGGSANAYDYVSQDPINESDVSGCGSCRTITLHYSWKVYWWFTAATASFSSTWCWADGKVTSVSAGITTHDYNPLLTGTANTISYISSKSINSRGIGQVNAVATSIQNYEEYGSYGDDWCVTVSLRSGGNYQAHTFEDVSGGGGFSPGYRDPCENWHLGPK